MKKTLLHCIQYNKHLLRVREIICFHYFSLLVVFHIDVCFVRLALSLPQLIMLNIKKTFLSCSQYNKHLLQNTKLQLKNHIKAVIFFQIAFDTSADQRIIHYALFVRLQKFEDEVLKTLISKNPANIQYINEMIMIIFRSLSRNGGMAVNMEFRDSGNIPGSWTNKHDLSSPKKASQREFEARQ